jgi:hypothetical protein
MRFREFGTGMEIVKLQPIKRGPDALGPQGQHVEWV